MKPLNATYIKIRLINGGASAVPAFFNLAHFSPTLILSRIFLPVKFSLLSATGIDDQPDDVFQLGGIARDHRDFCPEICRAGFFETLSLTANFIIIIILCWGGCRFLLPNVTTFHMVIAV